MAKMQPPPGGKDILKPLPLWFLIILPFYIGGILGVALFPIARDLGWVEAWIFIVTFAITCTSGFAIVNKQNPRVIRNRMKVRKEGLSALTKKSAGSDRWVMPLVSIGFFGALILPAYARRYGWSSLPFGVEIAGMILANAGAVLMFAAMLQNAYASKILDINQDQILIDTGLYSHVRHPLYAGAILMILAVPIALGSLLALVPAALAALTLILRIHFEEVLLVHGMEGYEEYQSRVRYKIIPRLY